jgi:hypothetical protein
MVCDMHISAKLHLSHSKPGCSETHPLVIDPVYVLKGLRNFAAKFSPKQHRSVHVIVVLLYVRFQVTENRVLRREQLDLEGRK